MIDLGPPRKAEGRWASKKPRPRKPCSPPQKAFGGERPFLETGGGGRRQEIRLYIKHHFRHLSVTQSVATLYIADGLRILRNPFDSFSLILPRVSEMAIGSF